MPHTGLEGHADTSGGLVSHPVQLSGVNRAEAIPIFRPLPRNAPIATESH